MEILLREREEASFAVSCCQRRLAERCQWKALPFPTLHRVHGSLDVVMVLLDLLLKVLLPVG